MKTQSYPDVALVRQKLHSSRINDLPADFQKTVSSLTDMKRAKPGQRIAVAVGSRGIDRLDEVVVHCLNFLKESGFQPFIVPAMGSHGGATDTGQKGVLEKLGITGSSMKAPILADMEAVSLGTLPCGLQVYFSKQALQADHIVVINRIKPHTKFRADIESGICKMITIGLGKADGAKEFHQYAVNHSFNIIEEAAKFVLNKINLLFGLALLEDGYGRLSRVEAVSPSAILQREKALLKKADSMMARIPFDPADILIIDHFGKSISGIGMDSNVTGRHRDIEGDFHAAPHPKRIFVRDLSPDSDGNGNGIGLADVTTKRLVDALDLEKTYKNALTAISPEKAAIPMYFDNDQKAIDACLSTIGISHAENARIIRVKDTKHLEFLQISKVFEPEAASNQHVERITPWEPIGFDACGNLTNIWNGLNLKR